MSATQQSNPANTISFQGAPGANSDMACRVVFPEMDTLPCEDFEGAFAAVHEGRARLAMIPVENSIAGRVADIHHLLPEGGLHIIGEYFHRVVHSLLALPGTKLDDLAEVHSHVQALGQCRAGIRALGLKPMVAADTAGAARDIAQWGDRSKAAIANRLAAEIYGLDVLREGIEDTAHNTTRFIILSREPQVPKLGSGTAMTSFIFQVRQVPAALFKALGGFATTGINMTKLESYVDEHFSQARFYAEVEGHIDDPAMKIAMEELEFFAESIKVMGCFPAAPFRTAKGK
ncbi:prephenate dehydratase [Radicibacter daui]|uniref:prephenate dehydratase n=1 Tax=Radicibacter daui TaxID=3064829 RepID=UPI004046DA5D